MSEEAAKYETGADEEESLAPCPCGEVPSMLVVEVLGKYGQCFGDCCGIWIVEFRNAHAKDQETTAKRAREAWERAPRQPLALPDDG